jgi:hypothetical protein
LRINAAMGAAVRALIDDTIKGVLRSIGDAGASPSNTTGYTLLYHESIIRNTFYNPANAETFTTTPLAANASYYGSSKDYLFGRSGFMGCLAYSDVASATDGFSIQQSLDGSNWDLYTAATSVSAGVGAGIKAAVVARYARVRYVNGGTDQTTFRLGGRYMIA